MGPKLPSLPDKIYFFRHAESVGNRRGLDDNSLKTLANHLFPITEDVGVPQAKALADYVKEKNILSECAEIYVTNFLRTQMTLDIVLKGQNHGLPIYQDSRLDEWWKGIYHSMNAAERAKHYPAEEEIAKREGWYQYRPPQGESGKDVELRLLSFLHDLSHVPFISGHGRVGGFLDRLLCKRKLDLNCNYPNPKNCELWLFSRNGDAYCRTSLFTPM